MMNDIMWLMNPKMTIGSRPRFVVLDPSKPNAAPPIISPDPISIPASFTSFC